MKLFTFVVIIYIRYNWTATLKRKEHNSKSENYLPANLPQILAQCKKSL